MCKSWCESILAIIILVFALWRTMYSWWIVVTTAIILLIHSFMCKKCFVGARGNMAAARKKR